MAMYEDEKKRQQGSALRAPNAAAPAAGSLPAVGRWLANRPEPQVPTFSAPDYTQPNPTNQPIMTRVPRTLAAPVAVAAAAAPGSSSTQARSAPGQSASVPAAAQPRVQPSPASPASQPPGLGGPKLAGGGSAIRVVRRLDTNTFTGIDGRTVAVQPAPAASDKPAVQSQRVQRTLSGPRVASTFGQSVRTMNDDAAVPQQGGIALRSADGMAEHYASKEVTEAQKKLLGDLDTQRFRLEMVANNPGRRGRAAIEALGDNARQQAAILDGQAQVAGAAVQGRANRRNLLDNTGLQQQGDTQRALIDADTRSGIAELQDATDRARIDADLVQQPTLQQDADGNYVSVTGTRAEPVMGADGKPLRAPRRLDEGQVTPAMQYEAISKQIEALSGLAPGADDKERPAYEQQMASLEAQRAALLPSAAKKPVRTGTSNGKKVVQYSDGSIEYAE